MLRLIKFFFIANDAQKRCYKILTKEKWRIFFFKSMLKIKKALEVSPFLKLCSNFFQGGGRLPFPPPYAASGPYKWHSPPLVGRLNHTLLSLRCPQFENSRQKNIILKCETIDYNNNIDKTLDVVFSRFRGFSFTITLRQKPKKVMRMPRWIKRQRERMGA